MTTSSAATRAGRVGHPRVDPRASSPTATSASACLARQQRRVRDTGERPARPARGPRPVAHLRRRPPGRRRTLSVTDPATGAGPRVAGVLGRDLHLGRLPRERRPLRADRTSATAPARRPATPTPPTTPAGYDYTLELPGGSGQVRLFDPMFCATGDNGHGGSYGAGDHWTVTPRDTIAARSRSPTACTTRKGTPANTADDGAPVADAHLRPRDEDDGRLQRRVRHAAEHADANRQDCASSAAHNQWVTLGERPRGRHLPPQRQHQPRAANRNVGAENLFSIWVVSGGAARVYGSGRMAAYTNLNGGLQAFYFAQIERVHAGKMMEIELFDPGEVSGNGFLRIQTPNGNAYNYATFDWSSDDGRSGTDVSPIQTSIRGRGAVQQPARDDQGPAALELRRRRPQPARATSPTRTAGGASSTTSPAATTRRRGRSASAATPSTSSCRIVPVRKPGSPGGAGRTSGTGPGAERRVTLARAAHGPRSAIYHRRPDMGRPGCASRTPARCCETPGRAGVPVPAGSRGPLPSPRPAAAGRCPAGAGRRERGPRRGRQCREHGSAGRTGRRSRCRPAIASVGGRVTVGVAGRGRRLVGTKTSESSESAPSGRSRWSPVREAAGPSSLHPATDHLVGDTAVDRERRSRPGQRPGRGVVAREGDLGVPVAEPAT